MKALITGASSGIGRDMARVLAKQGIDLILASRRVDRLRELKKELPVQVRIICIDLSKEENCHLLYQSVKDEHIDIFINNAGLGVFGNFDETDVNSEMNLIHVNICAMHILLKLFLRDFIKRDEGYILNTASSAAFLPGPMMSSYYASKSYILNLSLGIYEELRQRGSHVHLSILCPGPIDTEFNQVANVKFNVPSMSSEQCAHIAIQGMLEGKLLIIPGMMMKCAYLLDRITPLRLLLFVSWHMQKRKSDPLHKEILPSYTCKHHHL